MHIQKKPFIFAPVKYNTYKYNHLIEMTRLITNQGINVGQSIRTLGAGEELVFPAGVNEITVRNACTRIKNTTGMRYTVNRWKDGQLLVTRTY